MNEIASLQKSIEAAQNSYARACEQHARSRKHVMSLIGIVEQRLREKRMELLEVDDQREHLMQDYARLQNMLQDVMMAAERRISNGIESGAAELLATPRPEAPAIPLRLEPAASEAAPLDDGELVDPKDLRAGFKRALSKKRGEPAETSAPLDPTPAG